MFGNDAGLSRRSALTAGGAALAAILGLTGCAQEDDLAKQAKAGDNKNYVAGDGSVTEFAAADRKKPVEIKGTLFDGTTVTASQFQGKVTVLNFWFAACAPCRVEHPSLEALSKQGIKIYGVNYKDQLEHARAFLEELGDPYTALGRDEQGRMALEWGVYGVPETYVIDGQGKIILRFAGPITQRVMETTLAEAIKKARGN